MNKYLEESHNDEELVTAFKDGDVIELTILVILDTSKLTDMDQMCRLVRNTAYAETETMVAHLEKVALASGVVPLPAKENIS
jgi:hypothetical protein